MKTLLANLAAKSAPEEQLTGFRHWVFLRGDAIRYALAPSAVAIVFLGRLALTPVVGDASPYLLFIPAVLVASGLGGFLSVVLGFFVVTVPPTASVPESVKASPGAESCCSATAFKRPTARARHSRVRHISHRSWRPCPTR
jgi:hypothetical protein